MRREAAEAIAVVARDDAETTREGAAKSVVVRVTHIFCDFLDRIRGVDEQPARFVQAKLLDEVGWADSKRRLELAAQVPRTKIRMLGDRFEGEVLIQMTADPLRDVVEAKIGRAHV